jgi:uncharacterized repeat protein (TIGR01451 family)
MARQRPYWRSRIFSIKSFTKPLAGVLSLFVLSVSSALAQFTYTDTPGSFPVVNESTAPCSSPLIRSFSVPDVFTVADVDIAVLMNHTYRGDIRMRLRAPGGTNVEFVTGAGGGANNVSVRFDDEAGSTYAGNGSNHNTTPFQFTLSPQGSLTALDGVVSNGNWQLEICDQYNGDSGNYREAELVLTAALPQADLSVIVSASDTTPSAGASITLDVQIDNAGADSASGIEVFAQLPSGLTYVSDTGAGAYNPVTGVWTLPSSLGIGGSASLQITAIASSTGSGSFVAEVTASSLPDPDSTPDNRNTFPSEDDTGSVYINVGGTAGVAPSLSCTAPLENLDWDNVNSWNDGDLTGSVTVNSTLFDFAFSGDTSAFQNSGSFGGQSPLVSNFLTGGFGTGQDSLQWLVNFTSSSSELLLTINIGPSGRGVDNLQFTIFDTDRSFANPNFVDEVIAYGYLNGSVVTAVLTDDLANDIAGDSMYGVAASASADADGNATFTFLTPVDEVRLFYGSGPSASSNPAQQAVALHDLSFCPRGIDYSDAPSAFGAPSHLIANGMRLGAQNPDREDAATPGVNADGDDNTGTPDDEDGISFPSLTRGATASIPVIVNGPGGYLQAWIDFNGNNNFADAGEQIASNIQDIDGDGLITLSVPIPATATSAQTYARFRWSSTASLSTTALANDGEVEDYAISFSGAAALGASKTINVFDPGALGLYAVPGNDVIYTITATNTGSGAADVDSIEIIDALPPEVTFYNGDIDDAGPETDPVSFAQTGAGLTFTYASDVAYSNSATKPVNFAACTYTPAAGYDPAVTYICFNPKGAMASGSPDPNFSLSFRARID